MIKEIIKISKSIDSSFFEEKITLKDCSEKFLLKTKPELQGIIEEIKPFFFNKKFITFDYKEINNASGKTPTCADTNWHVDGKNNLYLICCWGDKRTVFLEESNFFDFNKDLSILNQDIKNSLKEIDFGLEVKNQTLYSYDSFDIHKGRFLEKGESRKFLRLCFSDYIKPSNKIIRF